MKTSLKGTPALRKRRSGGNVMLESVFTFLPLLAVILFFLDLGFMLFRWSTLQNAVREGCRYAVTFQTNGGAGQDASVEQVVQRYASLPLRLNVRTSDILGGYPAGVNSIGR